MVMEKYELQKLRDLPIEGVAERLGLQVKMHKAIAIPSATLLKRKDAEQLSTLDFQLSTRFAMFPDNDTPGERLFLQLKEVLPSLVHYQLPPGCKDFGEYFVQCKNVK